MASIISMPRSDIRRYSSSMSSTRGVRWLTCVLRTPPMSAATAEIRSSRSYQARSNRLRGELEGADGELEEPIRVGLGQLLVALGAVGQLQQLRAEQLPSGEERLELGAQVWIEEPGVRGREQGREHPEGVARELVGVDRPECRRDDRH
jgi:hypothetical protein